MRHKTPEEKLRDEIRFGPAWDAFVRDGQHVALLTQWPEYTSQTLTVWARETISPHIRRPLQGQWSALFTVRDAVGSLFIVSPRCDSSKWRGRRFDSVIVDPGSGEEPRELIPRELRDLLEELRPQIGMPRMTPATAEQRFRERMRQLRGRLT